MSYDHPFTVELAPSLVPGYAAILSLRGEHDFATVPPLRAALAAIYGNVLVDLSECGFMDSAVVGLLLARLAECQRTSHRLELVVPQANAVIARMIEILRLHDILTIHDVRPEAPRMYAD